MTELFLGLQTSREMSEAYVVQGGRKRGLEARWGSSLYKIGFAVAFLLCVANASEAAVDSCGEPPLLADSEAAVLLWEDCGTGMWHMRATAGGSLYPVSYEGTIVSDRPFNSVAPASIESGDLLRYADE